MRERLSWAKLVTLQVSPFSFTGQGGEDEADKVAAPWDDGLAPVSGDDQFVV
jgi:hypothetical protein